VSETATPKDEHEIRLDQIEPYYKKLFVTAAVIVGIGWLGLSYIFSRVDDLKNSSGLQGGPVFWNMVEKRLYILADDPDLPPAQKEKIVQALRKLSAKYHPYIEALSAPQPPVANTSTK
jgi:hypothetical protein